MSYRIPHSIVAHLRAWGLTVVELDGWQGRGHGNFPAEPLVIVDHHTGTPDSVKGDLPTKRVLIDGRSDLPGPLCNFGFGRSGTVYLVADGVAWHAGPGEWAGISVGNSHSAGIEAESAGGGKWTPEQLDAYPILNAALCDFWNLPAGHVCAHRESALPKGRKDDPVGIDMTAMRSEVAALLIKAAHHELQAQTSSDPAPLVKENTVLILAAPGHTSLWVTPQQTYTKLSAQAAKDWIAAGVPSKPVDDATYMRLVNAMNALAKPHVK